jgi:transcriptional regulator with XRE-family HTH domain
MVVLFLDCGPFGVEMPSTVKSPGATDVVVGQRIRSQRLMLGLSQTELGNKIGITFQQIQKYEKGTNRVSAGRLQQIAQLFKVPVSFFFEGAPGKVASAEHINESLEFLDTAASVRLVRAFAEIDDASVRRDIVALVEGIAEARKGRRKRR